MNKIYAGGIIFLFMLGLGSSPRTAHADEVSDLTAYHEAKAADYAHKAEEQDALIAEHQKMAKEYSVKFTANPKFGPPAKVVEMGKHCDQIVKESSNLKNEFISFAAWHRMRAAELKGQ